MTVLAPDQPRIMGSEMEYGFVPYDREGEVIPGWPDRARFLRALPSDYVHIDNFLPNGGKLYIDLGEHPEYASPECTDLDDLLVHEFAGELIAQRTFDQIASLPHTELAKFNLYKSVASDTGKYWGYHENYQFGRVDASAYRQRVIPLLAIHIATRGTLFGAGHLNGDKYQTSQKSLGVGSLCDATAATASKRPLIDAVRDEPHADMSQWQRIHIPSMDPNMLPWPTWMKFGTTSIVLRMIEAGVNLDDLLLANPVRAVHTVARDTGLKASIQLKKGRPTTGLDTQMELVKRARKFAELYRISDQDREVIDEWESACLDLKKDPSLCRDRVEWVIKRDLLGQFCLRHNVEYGDERLKGPANLWVNLDPSRKGGAQKLRASGTLPKMPTQAAIERAIVQAPKTRAAMRGRLVVALFAAQRNDPAVDGLVSWSYAKILGRRVEMPSPRQSSNRDVKRAIRKLKPYIPR